MKIFLVVSYNNVEQKVYNYTCSGATKSEVYNDFDAMNDEDWAILNIIEL